jgi:phosphoglycerate kinase
MTLPHVIMRASDCKQIGNSLFDVPGAEKVKYLVEKAKANDVNLVFPVDYIIADKFDKNAKVSYCYHTNSLLIFGQTGAADDTTGIPDGWIGLDVGPKSRELFRTTVLAAKTILWNGYELNI